MNNLRFERIVVDRLETCRKVLLQKNDEYASETDRLHNFKIAGLARGTAETTALDGMLIKHLVSIWDCVDKMELNRNYVPSEEWVREKVGDVINYMLLLEGCIEDRRARECAVKTQE